MMELGEEKKSSYSSNTSCIVSFLSLLSSLSLSIQAAGVMLLIVRLIICSITLECVAGPCYD